MAAGKRKLIYSTPPPLHIGQVKRCLARLIPSLGFPGGAIGKEPACQWRRYKELQVQSLGQEDPLEKEMANHSSVFAWRIPWIEEPGGLQSMGWQRVF